jgi:signal transduction histidine kinase
LRRLESALPDLDEFRAAVAEIVNDGERVSAVISRIRGLLMKGDPKRTELDINGVIRDVSILLRNELTRSRVFSRTDLEADLPCVPGDRVQVQQVLINLVVNATEAMPTSTDGTRALLIRSSAKGPDGVLVQVQDSEPGIKAELADRIFEPFFTPKAAGIAEWGSRSAIPSWNPMVADYGRRPVLPGPVSNSPCPAMRLALHERARVHYLLPLLSVTIPR